MNTKHTRKLAYSITLGLLLSTSLYTGVVAAPEANALPDVNNANVVGTNKVTTSGTTMTVAQDTTKATAQINWNSFNVGSAATVNFKQAGSGSTMINNVVGNNMSEIAGHINASGNIVLINPNGSMFYNGATVNVGGFAVYAAKQTTEGAVPDMTAAANLINESSITMQDGVTINAGISTALTQAKAMGMNMDDYAIGINQFANRIRLVANGNVNLGSVTLNANDTTYTDNSQSSLGEEGYSTSESSNEMYGQVAIRADANANDYGQVTVNGSPVITTQESRIYSNPDLVGVNTTADGVQYNRKNYNSMTAQDSQFNMTQGTHVTVTAKSDDTGTTILADKAASGKDGKYVTTATSGTTTANVRMLINNIAQLQDIDPNTTNNNGGNTSYGNLAGKYAMGKTIDATNDTASYLKDGILYTQDKTTGKIVGVAVDDNSVFTSATSKTLADGTTTITYDKANSQVTTGNYGYTSTGTFSKTSGTTSYTTNTGDTQSTYSDGTTTYTKDTTAGTTSYTSGTNTFASNGTSTTLNNGTNTFTKTGTTTSYNNGTYDIAQTSGTTSYTASGTTYSQTGTTTQYVSGSNTYALADGATHASLSDGTHTYTTDGTNVYQDGSTTPYAGTDVATILSNLNTATTSLTTAASILTPAAAALSNAATAITAADGNITTANTNIATFLSDTDNTTARTELGTAYTQFTTSTAALTTEGVGDKSLSIINSANWDSEKGFDPIGSTTAPFTGSMDGYGGDAGHPVNNLTIMRGGTNGTDGENNVGLFGVISGGSVSSFTLGGPKIQGQNNVGGIAGQLIKGGTISWSSVTGPGQKGVADYTNAADTGYVATTTSGTGARENIGAVAGLVDSSTISHVSNSATVIGQTNDGTINVSNVGGIAGKVVNDPSTSSAAISQVTNGGNVFGEKAVGGLVGYGENMSIGATAGKTDLTAASYNNGQITGLEDTGGIMGHAKGVTLKYVFNTNEDTPLSANSMYYIDDSGNIVKQGGTAGTALAGKALNSDLALSKYGLVTGDTNTGGMVGYMENYSATKKSSIDTAYNAGNVTATGENTGGIVGQMTGGTITNAYNGDNNTVIKSDNYDAATKGEKPVPTAVSGHAEWDVTVGSETKTFKYDEFSAKYYGFYTADGTAYYFIPTNGTTTKGAGGIYVNAAGDVIDVNNSASAQYVKESDRFYFNRLAYKDANITGTTNVGGVIGNMSGGDVSTVYDVGTVTSTDTATTGGLIGIGAGTGTGTEATTKLTDSFYITGTDKSLMNKVYSNQSKAIGSDTGVDKTGVESDGRTLAEMESRDTIKATYTNDDWLGSITKIDTDTGRTVYSSNTHVELNDIQWDGKEKIFSGATNTVLYYRPTIYGVQQTYYLKTGDETATQYTFSTDTSGNITLTGGGTSVTYEAEKVSSNQGTNWLVYEQQTLPLLKYYMTDIGLTRVFEYDGSTHNLKTDDVTNLYGRADFADGSGQVVYKTDEAESTKYPGSSEYYYDNSSIWSPQHGYIMDAMAAVTITPKALEVVVTGERTYGDVNNTQGYYLCVPYKDGETQKYAFYTVSGTGDTTAYSELSTKAQLDAFFGTYEQSEAGLKAKALADGHYVVTLNGIIDAEATAIDEAVSNAVTAVGNSSSGSSLNGIFSYNVTGGDQRLAATTADKKYTIDSTNVKGLVAQNNDYTITYSGALLVDKANLYYTYDGERNYGAENSTGTHTYTLVGNETDSTSTTINGYLKSFDAAKLNIGTGNVLTDGVGATGYTMTGVVKAGNANITANGTQAITAANTNNSYYQVMVDGNGKVLGYVLKTLDNGTSLSLTGKTTDDTTYLNNNYNLIWAAGGSIDNVRQTTSTSVTAVSITANDSTQKITPVALTMTVNGERNYGSTMDATTYTTSTGTPALTQGTYNVDITGLVNSDTVAGILNGTNVQALLNGIEDKTSEVSATKISDHTNAGTYIIQKGAEGATTLADSLITVAGQDSTSKHYNLLADKNYNYTLADGSHTEKIDKLALTIATNVSKEYGEENSTISFATTGSGSDANNGVTHTDIKSWDQTAYDGVNSELNTIGNLNVAASITKASNAGTYGKLGSDSTTKTNGAMTYKENVLGDVTAALGTNYDVKYADKLTITKAPLTVTVTGDRYYGNNMAKDAYTVNQGTLTNGTYNLAISGIKGVNGDTASNVLSGSGVHTALNGIEGTVDGNNTDTLGSHTNVGTYDITTTSPTLSNTKLTLTDSILGNSNYTVTTNGAHSVTIEKRPITLLTTGSKTYDGTATDPNTGYDIDGTKIGLGIKSWDSALLTDNKATWIGYIQKPNAVSAAGSYGTEGKTGNAYETSGYFTYTDADKTTIQNTLSNYAVSYKDKYDISGKKLTLSIAGTRDYGSAMGTGGIDEATFTYDGLVDDADKAIFATYKNAWYNYYADSSSITTTHAGTYGTKGATGNAYKTSGAIVMDDTEKGNVSAALGNDYIITYTDLLTVKPVALTINVNGERTYGDNMSTTTYTSSKGATIPATTNNGTWNVNLNGLVNGDTATTALNTKGMQALLNNIESGEGTATTTLGNHTNARATAYALNGTDLTGTTLTIAGKENDLLTLYQTGSRDYTISIASNSNNTAKIDTRNVTITTKGEKTYGNADPGTSTYTIDDTSAGSGLTSWDKTAYFTPNVNTWKESITNSTDESTHHGTYGTLGTPNAQVLKFDGATTETSIANTLNTAGAMNYNVTYADKFTINKRNVTLTTTAGKTYGDTTLTGLTIGADAVSGNTGITSWDKTAILDANQTTWDGLVDQTAATAVNLHAGTHGTNGTLDKGGILKYSETNTNTINTALSDYTVSYNDLLTVGKKDLTVTVTGERNYGINMAQSDYTTTTAATAPTDITTGTTGGLKAGKWNVNLNGLAGTDTAAVLSTTNVNTVLNALDGGTGNTTDTLGSHTNAGTYNIATTPSLSKTKVDLTNSILAEGDNGNYNIIDGNHQAKIDKIGVTITTTGSKTYGNADPATNTYTITQTGLTDWDKTNYYDNTTNYTKWQNDIINSTDEKSHVDTYGSTSVGATPVLTYGTSAVGTDLNTNYNVTYADTFTINKRNVTLTTTAGKTYGDTTLTGLTIGADAVSGNTGITSWDKTAILDANQTTWDGLVDQTAATAVNLHAGTHGTNGTLDKGGILKYSETNTNTINTALSDYTVSYNDLLTVGKKDLTVTVTGERNYGINMAQSDYTTTTAATAPTDTTTGTTGGLTAGKWNVNLNGLAGTDTAAVLNTTNVNTVLNALDGGTGNTTDTLGSHTNAGTYNMATTPSLSKTKVDLTNSILAEGDNGNYNIVDGNHQAKIDKIGVTITTIGNRKYGHENSTSTYTIEETGMTDWDKTALYGTDGSNWKGGINNSTALTTEKGVYGTLGDATPKNAVLTYDATNSQLAKDLSTNYNVTYADKFTIGNTPLIITITGSKTYSDATDLNSGKYTITYEGLENTDKLVYTGVINDVALYDNVGIYSKGNGTDTTHGITGLQNLSGFNTDDYDVSYKTTYTVNPKDLLLATTGSRVYGDKNDTITYGSIIADVNKAIVNPADKTALDKDRSALTVQVSPYITETTDAGTYGLNGSTNKNVALGYDGTVASKIYTDLHNNYNVKYVDTLTINKRPITHTLDGTKEYGTGSEHTTYTDGGFTNVPDFATDTVNSNTPKNIANSSDRTTPVGSYTDKLGVTYTGDWTKNYDITENTMLKVTPGDFTYTSDQNTYWRGLTIPPQNGKVTNKYGEDVSDLVGTMTWPTTADNHSPSGKYPVIGHGSHDNDGNYNVYQALTNPTALTIKDGGGDVHTDAAATQGLLGAWAPIKEPLLDVRYLNVTSPDGINRWGNGNAPMPNHNGNMGTPTPGTNPVSITAATDTLPEYKTEHPFTAPIHEQYTVMENEYGAATVQTAENDLNKKNGRTN